MARQPREWRTRTRVIPDALSTCALLPTCEATSLPDHGYLAAKVAACHIQAMDASATAFHARNRSRISPGERSEDTSELQSRFDLVCRLLLEKKNMRGGPE